MENLVQEILREAIKYRVDDIHLMPKDNDYQFLVRLTNGLQPIKKISIEQASRFISFMKYQANLDIGEKRRPQTGALSIKMADNKELELRISVIANYLLQESLVIRVLHQVHQKGMNQQVGYTFFPEDLKRLSQLTQSMSGLILFSGPVSSGKTTTIYQLLRSLALKRNLQVITMEDPVEIPEPIFLQTQVNELAGVSYDVLIKSALRHHPDVLMIGEIRDEETAKMAIRGALTGHLLIATVHAKDTIGVLSRLIELGISKNLLEQTLLAVCSQRLLQRRCPLCQKECSIYCNHIPLAEKKGTIFEILTTKELKELLRVNKEQTQQLHFTTLNDKLRKAYALGYISEETYQRYYVF
ncbi:competence protein ComGA [Granulicatella balaenopterae]|uniref:Competence protein ComGA n=1 Tax=Granulicatella balaenopterae TaxID=137733 RepID=A0A1H9L359_9LACT|nr:competence type IV pilus ATPase ComGA [Granulicatella balaenopterae]SER05790.1 competence protein ComGA [Granulicatella balaenopterae]